MTTTQRPNILFIMSDDHAAHAISSYGSRINRTPHIDRIAEGGMRFDNCFCTNSICTPSRAVILTGMYSHKNGVKTLADKLDNRQSNVAKLLQSAGYQTAIVGKWHLGRGEQHNPTGFDYWKVLPGQGDYHNPKFIGEEGVTEYTGYVTDLITDFSLDWLERRDKEKPFMLMLHHKAPHRRWEPDEKHATLYEDVDIPEPVTFHDDYANRSKAAAEALMRIDRDLSELDLKEALPEQLTPAELKSWKYQRYIKDYLRCIASVDDNVGRVLDYLDDEGIADNTMIIYTSDQGFFLGDHGWYDKRFMYEESLRMPFLVRYPQCVKPGTVQKQMALNVDFAETFLDYAGVPIPANMQGNSLRKLLEGETPEGWQNSIYYRYWEHLSKTHRVGAHYGVRTHRYKLIYYYGKSLGCTNAVDEERVPEWELFDLANDPYEMNNVYHQSEYADAVKEMTDELDRLRVQIEDFE
ncbi:N-acetylglucosamine-6-O-sulfatase [Paenibacillus solanacearum]|uniref:N-acetylglucosamine-6-O-sulfatase n=1 Tax=Paenibacillus solanacearum TaxID=2048548 RepID=A0A916K1U6_9BACL|nr:sulfatase [Paenibacillus solanacearum]CAG7629081.1 N-acetylglucosamine-6-O-sulfatase [Paenibacillus solanacearum]